jgi:hypothetical protein
MGFPKVHVFEVRIGAGPHLPCRGGIMVCPEKYGTGYIARHTLAPTKDRRWSCVISIASDVAFKVVAGIESFSESPSLRGPSRTIKQASRFSRFLVINIPDDFPLLPSTPPSIISILKGNVRYSNFQIVVSELPVRIPPIRALQSSCHIPGLLQHTPHLPLLLR